MSPRSGPPRLTAVVVTYQSRSHISRCLDSLPAAAAGIAFEVVVVDNASTDGTPDLVEALHPEARLVRSDSNHGFATSVNQAVSLARADTLLLLNPDAVMEPGSLSLLLEALARRPGAAGVGPALHYPDGSSQVSARPRLSPATVLLESLLLDRLVPAAPWLETRPAGPAPREVECLSGACLLVRSQAFEALGGFDGRFFMYGEDVDWCLRARRAGYTLWLVPQARVEHVEGGSSRQDPVGFLVNLHNAKVQLVQKHYPDSFGGLLPLALLTSLRVRAALHLAAGKLFPGTSFLRTGRHERAALRQVVETVTPVATTGPALAPVPGAEHRGLPVH